MEFTILIALLLIFSAVTGIEEQLSELNEILRRK